MMPSITSEMAETSETQVHPPTAQRRVRVSFWPEMVFTEELQPNTHNCNMGSSSNSTINENTGTVVQTNGSRCSGPMSENLAVAEGSLFHEGLVSSTIMSVCKQQLSMVDVPYKFGTVILQFD